MMQLKEIKERKIWNDFIITSSEKPGGEFLQSWEWGDFQRQLGKEVHFWATEDNQRVIDQILLIEYKLPFNKKYLYSPRVSLKRDSLDRLIEEIKKEKDFIFFRFDLKNDDFNLTTGKRIRDVQPSKTTVLDLKKSEEEIFSQMHPKTRYNIRLAQKHGVLVFEDKEKRYLKDFLFLLRQTSKREGFKIYSDEYYFHLLNLNPNFVRLYLAKYQERILAGHLLIFFGKTVTYLHGGSCRNHKEVMAPYLLHWEAIKQAKRDNFYFYDFWGINENKWPGLTRFKTNFGGQTIFYQGTFDLPFNMFWYELYKLGRLCFR